MIREFEIIKLIRHHNRGLFIFARHTGANHNFCVDRGSLFGGVPIYNYAEIRYDNGIFVFRPFKIEDYFTTIFNEGQTVQLILLSDTSQSNSGSAGISPL
jgi:ribosomal protein L30E